MQFFRLQIKIFLEFLLVLFILSPVIQILILDKKHRTNQGKYPNNQAQNYINYRPCFSGSPLTYIVKRNNHYDVMLKVNKSLIFNYTSSFYINCCYSKSERYFGVPNPNDNLRFSECIPFEGSVDIIDPIIKVVCKDRINSTVYSNIHAIISPMFLPYLEENTFELLSSHKPPTKVLIFGVRGISKNDLERKMPKTYNFLRFNNTRNFLKLSMSSDFLELFASLTENDSCDLNIWNRFKEMGYITAYGEDLLPRTLSSGEKNSFSKSPDFYFKPYMLEAANLAILNQELNFCTNSEERANRIIDLAKDFQITLSDYPTFGLFLINWVDNRISETDRKFKYFLKELHKHLENTVFMFFSHFRSVDARVNRTEIDNKLPFSYIHLPARLRKNYWKYCRNLKINSYKAADALDVYMFLQDILKNY